MIALSPATVENIKSAINNSRIQTGIYTAHGVTTVAVHSENVAGLTADIKASAPESTNTHFIAVITEEGTYGYTERGWDMANSVAQTILDDIAEALYA